MPNAKSAQRYRGASIEERRATRRSALIEAAIAAEGDRGYRNATVKAVCDEAGVTERYFYESFSNSEALLVASFETVTDILREKMERAAVDAGCSSAKRICAILNAYYGALQENPNAARVFLVEIGGVSPTIDEVLSKSLHSFAALLHDTLADGATVGDPSAADTLLRAGVVGAIVRIALTWIESGYRASVDTVVDAAARLCSVLDATA